MNYQPLLDELNQGTKHLVIDGPAGSGKTHLIRTFLLQTTRKVIAMATTGLAASHIGGSTIHNVFNFPASVYLPPDTLISSQTEGTLLAVDTILIDEASMLLCSLLDGINVKLQRIRKNSKPFGGVRLVLVGDHFQLGPVVNNSIDQSVLERMSPYYKKPYYYFQSEVFSRKDLLDNLSFFTLMGNFRHHEDSSFKQTLDRIRYGRPTSEDLDRINKRRLHTKVAQGPVLTMTGVVARMRNETIVKASGIPYLTINPKIQFFVENGKDLLTDHPALDPIILQVSSRVMLIKNEKEGHYQNGSLGIVSHISHSSDHDELTIDIKLDSGKIVSVRRERFDVSHRVFNEETGLPESTKVATIWNFPFRLAYAFTIHKAQGLTLEAATINRENGAFAPGQMYTSISRVTHLENLYLTQKLELEDFWVDPIIWKYLYKMKNRMESASNRGKRKEISEFVNLPFHDYL